MKVLQYFLSIFVFLECAISQINVKDHPGELCSRPCKKGDTKICYFEFFIEFYQAMGVACKSCVNGVAADCDEPECVVGDGIQKGFLSINRQLPGPAIQICQGDRLVVDVSNKAPGTGITIHWHGLRLSKAKFMDGVPFVTQCPIEFGTKFRYQFTANEIGTYFYHSHAGFQKANGIYGALIIRQNIEENPLAGIYDYDLPEHHFVISDWLHHYVEFLYPGIQSHPNKPDAVLLNGRGTFINNQTRIRETAPPPHIMHVEPGKRYRFRVIASNSFNCLTQLQIESHILTVIATDGYDVEPLPFDTIILNAGERFDFVLNANQPPGDYWIRLRGLGVCEADSLTEAFVLLRYKHDSTMDQPVKPYPDYDDTYPRHAHLNYPNQTCKDDQTPHRCVTALSAIKKDPELLYAKPDKTFYFKFVNHDLKPAQVFNTGRYEHFRNLVDDELEIATINKISFELPSSPMLSQPDESIFCDENNLPEKCQNTAYCLCVHRVQVPLNSIVELVLIDLESTPVPVHHPMHLHGYHFMVTDLDQGPPQSKNPRTIRDLIESTNISASSLNSSPPLKDTVSVPTLGHAVVRFRADNAGFWLFHCHYDFHMVMGMSLVLQVGELSDMPKAPENFPKCGNYVPDVFD